MTARILGAVVEFTVGYVVIIVVFVLNLVHVSLPPLRFARTSFGSHDFHFLYVTCLHLGLHLASLAESKFRILEGPIIILCVLITFG